MTAAVIGRCRKGVLILIVEKAPLSIGVVHRCDRPAPDKEVKVHYAPHFGETFRKIVLGGRSWLWVHVKGQCQNEDKLDEGQCCRRWNIMQQQTGHEAQCIMSSFTTNLLIRPHDLLGGVSQRSGEGSGLGLGCGSSGPYLTTSAASPDRERASSP